MRRADQQTISIYFVGAAVRHLPAAARERVLHASRIPSHLLDVPQSRVPANTYSALWLAVARELNDEFFGLDRRAMKVGSFSLLCHSLLTAQDLHHALKRMLRGFAALLDDVAADLAVNAGEATVTLTNRIQDEDDRRFADETALLLIHRLMCWLAGRRLPLSHVSFAHDEPPYAREYKAMYCDDIAFAASHAAMRFDAHVLKTPLVQTPSTLRLFLRTAPESVLMKYKNEDSWTAKVRQRLRNRGGELNALPVLAVVAEELRTTPTTLRRRLEAEGVSYQGIKDQLRNDIAIDFLCSSGLSIDEIAARLGFRETSAFHRAFKRWNKLQPGEYRRRRQLAGSSG